ncbi:hypothetical protein [Flavobacterium tructae]|uniref:Uncharacterized protein n=1 Tax=Flavobacterium tructae TaxID=1114873 RepID=A0A1S1J2J4_9FLAO|nr:hypothetical protein [Flavobacterium tructae]OHT43416.1 hypothetical protein BHE19_19200 [Flavobacterium tructae]OXB19706.1 hypothetical protein B0A71_09655 [Flavobacterium tructae]
MLNTNEFIEFDIFEIKKFEDMKRIFKLIKEAKELKKTKGDKFWIENFPKYSLQEFYFIEDDIKPDFKTAKLSKNIWHFYSLIELLEVNYEIEYIDCLLLDSSKGRLTFNAYSYPYGGTDGLIAFIKSFGCPPTKIYDGTEVVNIKKKSLLDRIKKFIQ